MREKPRCLANGYQRWRGGEITIGNDANLRLFCPTAQVEISILPKYKKVNDSDPISTVHGVVFAFGVGELTTPHGSGHHPPD
ncbi:hypothetical protein ACQ86E_27670 [Bradyrhizobium betae]|uniref:hypothetical protein n=1 Tax=Bradyrhizobium betae TaxID=244734 RepID=UPI003D66F5DB